jgi:hypothetical protein
MTDPSDAHADARANARTRLLAAVRADPGAAADALLLAQQALLDVAAAAGDVPFWNENGDGYEALGRINALLQAPGEAS